MSVLSLCARIYREPRDPDARLVYADALQERNDPRGQFIALQFEDGGAASMNDEPCELRLPPLGSEARRLLDAHEDEWIGSSLRDVLHDRRYEHGFLSWARLVNSSSLVPLVDDANDNDKLATIRVLACGGDDKRAYQRLAFSNVMQRSLRCIEIANDAMLNALCHGAPHDYPSPAWPFTHLFLPTRLSPENARRLDAAILQGKLPSLKRLTLASRSTEDIDDLLPFLSASMPSAIATLEEITLELLDTGNHRGTEIAAFLSVTTEDLTRLTLRVHDDIDRHNVSSYLARIDKPRRRDDKDRGEHYASIPTSNKSSRALRVHFLGHRAGYVGVVLEKIKGVSRLEIVPEDPSLPELDDRAALRDDIWRVMNSPAPGVELPAPWSRPPLPPSPEFGSMSVDELPTYFSLDERDPIEAWEKIRGWDLNEEPASVNELRSPSIDHLILTEGHVIFCTETNRRLARKFTFARYNIQRVVVEMELPAGTAPEGYGLLTIHTPSGRTVIIAPESIAQTLGRGWV